MPVLFSVIDIMLLCCLRAVFFRKFLAHFSAMFLLIVGSVVLGAVIWFLVKKDPEPLLGIYAQPGITYSTVVCHGLIAS